MKLPKEMLSLAIEASVDAGAIGIQTGNGFGRSVTTGDVKKLVQMTNNCCQIKAVGGLHGLESTLEVLYAGATLVGTSKGLELMQLLRAKKT